MSATRHCSNRDAGSSLSANRYRVPFAARNASAYKPRPGSGSNRRRTACRSSPARALPTPAHTLPRNFSSPSTTCANVSAQPGSTRTPPEPLVVLPSKFCRTAKPAFAAAADCVHRHRSSIPASPHAAACSNALITFSDQPCQNEASSTPDDEPAANTCARAAATFPSRHPAIRDHRTVSGRPSTEPSVAITPTGPTAARAAMVTARTSGRVEVTTTAPGASSTRLMTTYTPLPAPDGPSSTTESRTLVNTSTPLAVPQHQPRSVGRGFAPNVGLSSVALASNGFRPTARRISPAVAIPGRMAIAATLRRSRPRTLTIAVATAAQAIRTITVPILTVQYAPDPGIGDSHAEDGSSR